MSLKYVDWHVETLSAHSLGSQMYVSVPPGHAGTASHHAGKLVGPDERQAAEKIRPDDADLELQSRVWNTDETANVGFV